MLWLGCLRTVIGGACLEINRISHPLAFAFLSFLSLWLGNADAQNSSFTMLFQDDCGGLEFEDPDHPGSFVPAAPVHSALALNIGDMLQRLSNGAFSSSPSHSPLPNRSKN